MQDIDRFTFLIKKVQQKRLSLEHATYLLSTEQFKPYINPIVIFQLSSKALLLSLESSPLAYLFSKISYEASMILAESEVIAFCSCILGITLLNLSRYWESLHLFYEALEYYKQKDEKRVITEVLANLGTVYRCLGDYPAALRYFHQALEIHGELKDLRGEGAGVSGVSCTPRNFLEVRKDLEQIIGMLQEKMTRQGKRNLFDNQGRASGPREEYLMTINQVRQSLKMFGAIANRQDEASILGSLGNTYLSQGNYPKAAEYLRRALKIFIKIKDVRGEGASLNNLGLAYRYQGDYSKAIDCYKQALRASWKIKDRLGIGDVLNNIGTVYSFLGKHHLAIESYQQALNISREIEGRELEGICLGNLGNAYCLGLNQNSVAYDYYQQSLDVAEKMRGVIKKEEQRLTFLRERLPIYDNMILLCNRMKNEEGEKLIKSFEYLERSKSRTFLESLAHTPLKPSREVPSKCVHAETKLLQEMKALYLRKERRQIASLEEIEKLESELDEVWNEINKIDPEYVSMRRGKPLGFSQIQQLIESQDEKVGLVEYFLTLDKLLIFVLRSDESELKIEEVDIPSKWFNYYTKKYLEEVHDSGQENMGQVWQNLSCYLIDPIFKHLDGIDMIYFVPHRAIHYLPLHALRHGGKYMIERYRIAYSSSASVISYCQNKRRDKKQSCLSVGVVFEEEAERVAEILGEDAVVYKGIHVTKDLVERKSRRKDIIHFSCHGFFHPQMPMKSGLILANDEILTVEEIFQLKLDADLVTLSACQTGINEQRPGDDLIGLTRSFIYAGTPSVVVSLWSVYSRSTIELMERFYTYLKDGRTKAEALQKAQLDIMKKPEYSHPYHWAPFILVGDWK